MLTYTRHMTIVMGMPERIADEVVQHHAQQRLVTVDHDLGVRQARLNLNALRL